jgi:hypothetical protein
LFPAAADSAARGRIASTQAVNGQRHQPIRLCAQDCKQTLAATLHVLAMHAISRTCTECVRLLRSRPHLKYDAK